jgi:pantoate--beta-alanine ligase
VFGLKDLQQCAVVRRLASGLDFPIRLELVETVRDENGLALSSRNARLSPEQRSEAADLHRTLTIGATEVRAVPKRATETLGSLKALLDGKGFEVDYLACVDPLTMQEQSDLEKGLRVICAAKFHGVRLIDNVPV